MHTIRYSTWGGSEFSAHDDTTETSQLTFGAAQQLVQKLVTDFVFCIDGDEHLFVEWRDADGTLRKVIRMDNPDRG